MSSERKPTKEIKLQDLPNRQEEFSLDVPINYMRSSPSDDLILSESPRIDPGSDPSPALEDLKTKLDNQVKIARVIAIIMTISIIQDCILFIVICALYGDYEIALGLKCFKYACLGYANFAAYRACKLKTAFACNTYIFAVTVAYFLQFILLTISSALITDISIMVFDKSGASTELDDNIANSGTPYITELERFEIQYYGISDEVLDNTYNSSLLYSEDKADYIESSYLINLNSDSDSEDDDDEEAGIDGAYFGLNFAPIMFTFLVYTIAMLSSCCLSSARNQYEQACSGSDSGVPLLSHGNSERPDVTADGPLYQFNPEYQCNPILHHEER